MSKRLGDFNAKVIDQFLTSSVNMTKTTTIFKPLSLKSFCAAVAMSNNFHASTSNNFNLFSLTERFVNISADLFSIVKVVIFHLQVRLYEFHQFTGYRIFRKVEKIWQESATTHHLQRLCPGWLHTHPLVILQKKRHKRAKILLVLLLFCKLIINLASVNWIFAHFSAITSANEL